MFLATMSIAYHEEKLEDGSERVVLRIPPALAPVKLAVLPLVKKDGLAELGEKIFNDLRFEFNCQYDEGDSIGKRYRRQDAIGTPFCITIDHQTLEDGTVTIRERDTMQQSRVKVEEVKSIIDKKTNMNELLKSL
jgi:glycyl-tRNA synthetase